MSTISVILVTETHCFYIKHHVTVKSHFKTLYVGLSCAVYKYNKLGPLQSADTLRARYHRLVLVMVTLCIRYEYVRHALYIRYLFV